MENSNLVIASQTKIKKVQYGKHFLIVHEKYVDGQLVGEAFTLESLVHCMGIPKSTVEGRYARGRLCNWKVDMPNGYGRPARGFPLALLDQVVHILQTPGARVNVEPNQDTVRVGRAPRAVSELRPTYHQGAPYYTVPDLAAHFGYSETTIRKKLDKAGLLRKQVDLTASLNGGRPKRGFPQSLLGSVRLAICENVSFKDKADIIMSRTSGLLNASQREMVGHITPHTPPAKGSMREWDNDTLAPVVPMRPLNSVNPQPTFVARRDTFDAQAVADELAAELEAIVANDRQPTSPQVVSAPPRLEAIMEPEDDPAEIKRQAWAWQVNALSGMEEEPSAQDLRDTCEMMALDKAESERFIEEVKTARLAREQQGE